MNTRMRVKALPALLAGGFAISRAGSLSKVLAQSTPAVSASSLGLSELTLTATADGIQGMPESVAANRYLVTITGPAPDPENGPSGVQFGQLPEGLSMQDAVKQAQGAKDAPPDFYYDTHFAGGVALSQGTSAWGVVDLTPGHWFATTPYLSTMPVEFDVTGTMPTSLPDPGANVTIELSEFAIKVSDGAFKAGDNLVEVVNNGGMVHFIDIEKAPDGTTEDQINDLMTFEMTGTPVPGGLTEDQFQPTAYIADQTHGTSQWTSLNFEAGTYFLACWVGDPATGMPHAMMGMWTLVTI